MLRISLHPNDLGIVPTNGKHRASSYSVSHCEEGDMNRTQSSLGSLLLAAVLVLSAVNIGCSARVRIYDSDHADWHRWNHDEDHAYRNYLSENHKEYRDYSKLSGDEQSQYWNWRHGHSDNH
jgi:hypothetical protein